MQTNLLKVASLWLLSLVAVSTSATEIYPANGNWYLFDVDSLISQSGDTEWIDAQADEPLGYVGDGSPLTFSFSVATSSILKLVDAGLSGDVFSLSINGENHTTSAVAANSGLFSGTDFDSAWTTDEFSRLSVFLDPGYYTVTGFLNQSAVDEFGSPYLATVGGLQIVEADEPGILILLSMAMIVFGLRRRTSHNASQILDKGALS